MRTYMEHEFYILNVILDLKIIKIDKRKGKNFYLPAMVFKNMRYSKFDISLRCHFCVILELLINCLGDIIDALLQE